MKIRIKKGDMIVIILGLLMAGIVMWKTGGQSAGEYAVITADGKTEKYALSQNKTLRIETGNGEKNVVVIYNHEVYMKEASCPDQICVHHRPIAKNRESIICLPNEVYIEIESEIEKETDN